ncbi:MAG: hypothetical protein Ta2B_13620 [Termitinemataceae bacterium]|nr:MAG: hypothetical protein Ta2B_13620 [Termitinemataceae bacterium]
MQTQKTNLSSESDAIKSIIVDFIFTFLPLVVLLLIKLWTATFENIFVRSDCSYISMILFGQTIIKMFSGISENRNTKRTARINLHISLIISLGLVPSIIILVLLETGNKHMTLLVSQVIWLILSVLAYLFFGAIGNILSNSKIIKDTDFITGSET